MNDKPPVTQLTEALLADPSIDVPTKQKIEAASKTVVQHTLVTDPWIYRMVVFFLGSVVLLTVAGGVKYGLKGADFPAGLIAIGSAAVGALAGLLAPPPSNS